MFRSPRPTRDRNVRPLLEWLEGRELLNAALPHLDRGSKAPAEITVAPDDTSIGSFTLAESDVTVAHKNKYGREYDRPEPDSPAYARP